MTTGEAGLSHGENIVSVAICTLHPVCIDVPGQGFLSVILEATAVFRLVLYPPPLKLNRKTLSKSSPHVA